MDKGQNGNIRALPSEHQSLFNSTFFTHCLFNVCPFHHYLFTYFNSFNSTDDASHLLYKITDGNIINQYIAVEKHVFVETIKKRKSLTTTSAGAFTRFFFSMCRYCM